MSKLIINKLFLTHKNKILVNLIQDNEQAIVIEDSIALVGQSGSGKSLTLKAILNMIPKELELKFEYKCDFSLDYNTIAFIPQNPFTSLSPMTKIYQQFFCDDKSIEELLILVQLDVELKNKFPSQLSGGQLQRVVIAIALSKKPKLLLLDEPTTALDEKSKKSILDILNELKEKLHFIIIFVSHDINSIKNICKQIIVLKNGVICESGDMTNVLKNPKHQYTKELIQSNFKNRKFRL